jgi:hypothetical protein
VAGTEPDDRANAADKVAPAAPGEAAGRRLDRPPSDRYRALRSATADPSGDTAGSAVSALRGPLARALIVSLAGATALVAVGALFASTAGLLFTAGVSGGAVGLVLARAAVPRNGARPVARRAVGWLAVGLAIGAVAVAALATWLIAQREGGTLGLVDYLVETFGPFIPGEAVIAAVAAAWGANSGPVQS